MSRILYHFPLCPFSRKTRLLLAEKGLSFELQQVRYWEESDEFLRLNPGGFVPVLEEENGVIIVGDYPILEYVNELYEQNKTLMGRSFQERAEVRRLIQWFDVKFYHEVSLKVYWERVEKRLWGQGFPSSSVIREGLHNIQMHLDYIAWIVEQKTWLAGSTLSMADLTAAAHLSSLDFLGDIPWERYPATKEWYMRIKSRPSFRPLLQDLVAGLRAAAHYDELDF
jgi:glutathione S-transferase